MDNVIGYVRESYCTVLQKDNVQYSIRPSNNLFKSILNVFLFCLVNDLNIHKNNVNMYSSSHCLDWTDAVLLNSSAQQS